MCGIAGAIWTDPSKEVSAASLVRMTDSLAHRGPDDAGQFRSGYRLRPPYEALPGIALGHRRLAIIDVAGGHQPMGNEDGSVQVVCNGEIYNHAALRNRLEGSGHIFRTRCDTEVIVHLYEDLGTDAFVQLEGMFALAVWDARRRRLVLARDRLGQKPLVYRRESGRLLFASELKGLLQLEGLPREIDHAALDAYLAYQYVPHPRTIFRGFSKLPPAHVAVWHNGTLELTEYWRPSFSERTMPQAEAVAELRSRLSSAVTKRLMSDVPLGALLSGGIDSSLVVALMQKELHRRGGGRVKTFSIGFPVAEYDETKYARLVADRLGTEHTQLTITPMAVEMLPRLVEIYDEPFGDSSAIPTWYVCRLAREHVTVALTGDGGDELFAGYPRYRAVHLAQRMDALPAPLRWAVRTSLGRGFPSSSRQKSTLRRLQRFAAALHMSPEQRYFDWIGIFNEQRRAELYSDAFLETLTGDDPLEFLRRAWGRAEGRDAVTRASAADLFTYLPCDLMTKVDMASMSHGLECRQPFLDHALVEFAAGLPIRWKFSRGRGKKILHTAFGDLLPREIWRRPKMGFGVPLDQWFRGDLKGWVRDALLDSNARCAAFFNPEVVRSLVDEHHDGKFDHSYRLWSLLVLEMWLREWG